MRLVGDYRSFIEGFSRISHPTTSLRRKGVKFESTAKYQESFHRLKELLMRASALEITDPIKDCVVWKDACKDGINGILTQEGHVIGPWP